MSKNTKYEQRELRWAYYFGTALTLLGFWFLLHGALSLMGGFGLERSIAKRYGHTPLSETGMLVECFAGGAVFLCGLAVRLKSSRLAESRDKQD